jgi:hypothetical protein
MNIHTWHWLIVCGVLGLALAILTIYLEDKFSPKGGYFNISDPLFGCFVPILLVCGSIIFGQILWLSGATLHIGVSP